MNSVVGVLNEQKSNENNQNSENVCNVTLTINNNNDNNTNIKNENNKECENDPICFFTPCDDSIEYCCKLKLNNRKLNQSFLPFVRILSPNDLISFYDLQNNLLPVSYSVDFYSSILLKTENSFFYLPPFNELFQHGQYSIFLSSHDDYSKFSNWLNETDKINLAKYKNQHKKSLTIGLFHKNYYSNNRDKNDENKDNFNNLNNKSKTNQDCDKLLAAISGAVRQSSNDDEEEQDSNSEYDSDEESQSDEEQQNYHKLNDENESQVANVSNSSLEIPLKEENKNQKSSQNSSLFYDLMCRKNNKKSGKSSAKASCYTIYIMTLVVDPSISHQGVGSYLIDLLTQQLLNKYYDKSKCNITNLQLHVDSNNNIAIQLYKKCSFQVINIMKNHYYFHNKYHDALLMNKNINIQHYSNFIKHNYKFRKINKNHVLRNKLNNIKMNGNQDNKQDNNKEIDQSPKWCSIL